MGYLTPDIDGIKPGTRLRRARGGPRSARAPGRAFLGRIARGQTDLLNSGTNYESCPTCGR